MNEQLPVPKLYVLPFYQNSVCPWCIKKETCDHTFQLECYNTEDNVPDDKNPFQVEKWFKKDGQWQSKKIILNPNDMADYWQHTTEKKILKYSRSKQQ